MQTLSHGYKLPQNTDTGDVVFPAMEENIRRLNDHNHDPSNSAPLASIPQEILAANWAPAPIGGGLYRQLVTMPAPFTYDVADIWFKFSSGEIVYPSVERVSSNSFYVYTNDNTLTYVAYFR